MSNKANNANEKSFLLLEQMLKSLFNVANKVSTVSQNENELAKKVENMVNQAGNIQKATQMMDEIADKTNLLSLNASIEAARAGTFGRGFSVIAEDVRQLAQSSEEFLGNVAQITKELLQSINEVSAELKKNAQSVQALNDDTALLVDDANEVKLCNQDARTLVTQCTKKIKISQENI
ncbi:methyl-accepting chemotaxis protein [Campylobacter jejuni]